MKLGDNVVNKDSLVKKVSQPPDWSLIVGWSHFFRIYSPVHGVRPGDWGGGAEP